MSANSSASQAQTDSVRSAHDEDFAVYTSPQVATLVLNAGNFVLDSSNSNVQSPKLMVYTDRLHLQQTLRCPAKILHLHCNSLTWLEGTVIDVSSKEGLKDPAVKTVHHGPPAKGEDGGHIVLHVHDLPLHVRDNKLTFWPRPIRFRVAGGSGESFLQNVWVADIWKHGVPGSPGTVTILYSNSLLRAYAQLEEAYTTPTSEPARLQLIRDSAVPSLKNELAKLAQTIRQSGSDKLNGTLGQWESDLRDIEKLVNHWQSTHVAMEGCSRLTSLTGLASYSNSSLAVFMKCMAGYNAVVDLSFVPEDVLKLFTRAHAALQELNSLDPSLPANSHLEARQRVFDALAAAEKLATPGLQSQSETLLPSALRKARDNFRRGLNEAASAASSAMSSDGFFRMRPVGFQVDASEDLKADVPLVHPEQCSMALRRADDAFFIQDHTTALSAYQTLKERLRFVGLLKDGDAQYAAILKLEHAEKLALWSFDTLQLLEKLVSSRIKQLASGLGMFNLPPGTAPRMPFHYYYNYAGQQLDRLQSYEAAYWEFFDKCQARTQSSYEIRSAQALNMYQSQMTKDRQEATVDQPAVLQKELDAGSRDYTAKKNKFIEDLNAVKNALQGHQHIDPVGIATAVGSYYIGMAAIFLRGPLGAVAGMGFLPSAASKGQSMYDDAHHKIKDSTGTLVNKDYLIDQFSAAKDDLEAHLKGDTAKQNADGTRAIDTDGNAKILATKQQIDTFLTQFKDKFPENAALKKSLDDFMSFSTEHNNKLVAYNSTVLDIYQQILQQKILDAQHAQLGSQMIRLDQGLPSILGHYCRLKDQARLSILRTIQQGVLALAFWGLRILQSSNPQGAYHLCLDDLAPEAQPVDLMTDGKPGIRYHLSETELGVLKIGALDPFTSNSGDDWRYSASTGALKGDGSSPIPSPRIFTTTITGLEEAARSVSNRRQNPFTGLTNVRLTKVTFSAPGLCLQGGERITNLSVELRHAGTETIVDPRGRAHKFRHAAITMLSNTRSDDDVEAKPDDHAGNAEPTATQSTAGRGASGYESIIKIEARVPIGPFDQWRVVLREKDMSGALD